MYKKVIRFSKHAMIKCDILAKHGLGLDEKLIITILERPEKTEAGSAGRKIAQGRLDENKVLRIIYEENNEEIVVVTFYPGKRERYG
ncbi:MAG: hypothetical protein JXA46_10810 [Dehalococcoidales bacterium]|nr:hypothetical protein [Dehalococcoidales bacterium]